MGLLVIREPEEQDYDWKRLNAKLLAPYAKVLWEKIRVTADLNWYEAQESYPETLRVSGYGDGSNIFLEDKFMGKRKTMSELQQQLSVSVQDLVLGKQYRWIFPDVNKTFYLALLSQR